MASVLLFGRCFIHCVDVPGWEIMRSAYQVDEPEELKRRFHGHPVGPSVLDAQTRSDNSHVIEWLF